MAKQAETEKATYSQLRCKCMACGLHFTVHTWYPERHAVTTLYCPECGQHEARFIVYRATVEGYIFNAVPGAAIDSTEIGLL